MRAPSIAEARLLLERMLGHANHLGLCAEQTNEQGEALGNFPQTFTHFVLISAAFNSARPFVVNDKTRTH
jgi:GH15 family glucan-1,4-alpha-glucosidase